VIPCSGAIGYHSFILGEGAYIYIYIYIYRGEEQPWSAREKQSLAASRKAGKNSNTSSRRGQDGHNKYPSTGWKKLPGGVRIHH
jgi:hypothetical protein